MTALDNPFEESFNRHQRQKGRDPISQKDPVSHLLHKLDDAASACLYHNGSELALKEAFEAVLAHPESTWTRDVLSYRMRKLHYS